MRIHCLELGLQLKYHQASYRKEKWRQNTGARQQEGAADIAHPAETSLPQSLVAMQERRPSVIRSSPNSEKLENSEFHAKFLFLKIFTTKPNFKSCCGSEEKPTKTWICVVGLPLWYLWILISALPLRVPAPLCRQLCCFLVCLCSPTIGSHVTLVCHGIHSHSTWPFSSSS